MKAVKEIKIGIKVPTDRKGMDGVMVSEFVEAKIETILDLEKLISENINRRLWIYEDGKDSTYEISYKGYQTSNGIHTSEVKTIAFHTQRLWDDVFEGKGKDVYNFWK